MILRERVHGILLAASVGQERITASKVSECLYNAGLGLRYVQVNGCGTPTKNTNPFSEYSLTPRPSHQQLSTWLETCHHVRFFFR